MKQSKIGSVFVCCPSCSAPIIIPKKVEDDIESYRSCECWDCKFTIRFDKEFRFYVKATRAFEEDCY